MCIGMKKIMLATVLVLAAVLPAAAQEEAVLVDFDKLLESSDPDRFITAEFGRWGYVIQLETKGPPSGKPNLVIAKVPELTLDGYKTGEQVLGIKGTLGTDAPSCRISFSQEIKYANLYSLAKIGLIRSLSITIRNPGDPVNLSVFLVDEEGHTYLAEFSMIPTSSRWIQYYILNPYYEFVRNYPGISHKKVRLGGFLLWHCGVNEEVLKANERYFSATEEEKLTLAEWYEMDPRKLLPALKGIIDLQIGEILLEYDAP